MRAVDLLKRARRLIEKEPTSDGGPVEEVAEAFAAVIAASGAEGEPVVICEALGATFAVLTFYEPENRPQLLEAFRRGLERGRLAALAEEGVGLA